MGLVIAMRFAHKLNERNKIKILLRLKEVYAIIMPGRSSMHFQELFRHSK